MQAFDTSLFSKSQLKSSSTRRIGKEMLSPQTYTGSYIYTKQKAIQTFLHLGISTLDSI